MMLLVTKLVEGDPGLQHLTEEEIAAGVKASVMREESNNELAEPRGSAINPLNAELNPICHLLVLLGDLTFMGPCIVSIFQYISNKMQRYTVYLYLETAVHISGGTSTHHQESIQLSRASGICHTVTAVCCYRGRAGTGLSVLWVAYATHSTLKPVPALPR
jgi:hypothetical protein